MQTVCVVKIWLTDLGISRRLSFFKRIQRSIFLIGISKSTKMPHSKLLSSSGSLCKVFEQGELMKALYWTYF